MRREPTPFERKLWFALRAKRWGAAKFRRQTVIGGYIVDFSCRMPRQLVVEIDGDTHGLQEDCDERRTADLNARGYEVLRFTNADIGENLEGVLQFIEHALAAPLPSLSPEGERVI
jgi:very-short-patch-repair endonuclease